MEKPIAKLGGFLGVSPDNVTFAGIDGLPNTVQIGTSLIQYPAGKHDVEICD